jgi:hypothetical protein
MNDRSTESLGVDSIIQAVAYLRLLAQCRRIEYRCSGLPV